MVRGEGVALVLSGLAVDAWKRGGSQWTAWSSRAVSACLQVGKGQQSVVTGTPIAFTVEATGDDLQFLWQKDGKDIDKNESWLQCSQTDNTSTLHIQHVKKSDQGHYKCIVENPVKESEKTSDEAELTVREFFYLAFWVCVHGADYRILIPFW